MSIEDTGTGQEGMQEPVQSELQSDESTAMGVVRAVAATAGRAPVRTGDGADALEPLADFIDPEALDRLFESRHETSEDAAVVKFHYCDHLVTVTGGTSVTVTVE